MHLGPDRVERSTEKRWHSYGKCVSAKRDIVLADQPKRMNTVSACIRIAKCMTHVRGSLIQKADVRRPMQAQVESTTQTCKCKALETACRERSNGAPQLFFDSQRQECCAKCSPAMMQSAELRRRRNVQGRREGLAKGCKTCELTLPPNV